jgi:hypothetical protein
VRSAQLISPNPSWRASRDLRKIRRSRQAFISIFRGLDTSDWGEK